MLGTCIPPYSTLSHYAFFFLSKPLSTLKGFITGIWTKPLTRWGICIFYFSIDKDMDVNVDVNDKDIIRLDVIHLNSAFHFVSSINHLSFCES